MKSFIKKNAFYVGIPSLVIGVIFFFFYFTTNPVELQVTAIGALSPITATILIVVGVFFCIIGAKAEADEEKKILEENDKEDWRKKTKVLL